jgi:hypothetical protein
VKNLTTENTEGTERATPETDSQITTFDSISKYKKRFKNKTGTVSANFARNLERERDEAREELGRIESLLLDPHAVFLNFLHGKIAKLDWQKLEHIHGPHPARQAPAWIPVSQALPDDDQTVLVHMDDGEVWTGFLDAEVWRFVSGDQIDGEVLHWAHFPAPPEP